MRASEPEIDQPVDRDMADTPFRRVSLVETVAIHLLSAPIDIDYLRTSLVSGDIPPVGRHGWPLMLTRKELCGYLGVSWRTLKRVLTVAPIDLGANVVRYSREQIDTWAATRPSVGEVAGVRDPESLAEEPADAVAAALDRARRRGGRRQ